MDEGAHAPGTSRSSPTVQNPRESEDERQPLLGSGNAGLKGLQTGQSMQDSRFNVVTRIKHWNWRNLIVLTALWLAYGVVNCASSIMGPFFPNEALAKGSSPTTTGVIMGAAYLAVAIFSPLVGYFLPTLGLRYTLVSGLLLVGGSVVLLGRKCSNCKELTELSNDSYICHELISFMHDNVGLALREQKRFTSLMPSGWIFIVFCVLLSMTQGVGSAMFTTAAYALLVELFPNNVSTVMGVFGVATGLAYMVGPPLGGFLYAAGGFKLPFIAVGGAMLVLVPVTFLLVGNMSCKANKRMSLKTILKVSTNLGMIILVLATLLGLAAMQYSVPIMEPFLTTKFHLTPEQVGLVFLSSAIFYMLASLVTGPLADKFGPRCFEIFGFVVCGIGSVLLGPADFIAEPTLWMTIAGFCVLGAGAAFALIPIYSDMLTLAKSLNVDDDQEAISGIISGISSSSQSLGQFAGPLIGGVVVQLVQFQETTFIFGEVSFAQALLLLGATLIDFCYRRITQS